MKTNLVNHFFNTINLTCKKTFENISEIIEDKRQDYLVLYPLAVIIMEAILIHIFNAKSRHNGNFKLRKKKIVDAVNKFLKTKLDTLSHGDNIEKIFKKLSVQELQDFLSDIIFNLIRSKKIKPEDMLFDKYYLIAIDMTQTQTFKTNQLNGKTIKGLLFQTNNGKTTYSRKVVEAKLLLPNKMSLPLMTEFVSNDDSDEEDDEIKKQDCELKAAYRLMDKLKQKFPGLLICLLMDGLYPNQTIFQKCQENNWKYIITFKEDKIPTLFNRYEDLKRVHYYYEKKKIINANINQRFKFMNNLKYLDYKLNVVEMNEYETGEGKTYHNIFITNIEITHENVYIICKAGRLRWKIEHSFNKQKNLLFNLTHIFSKDENAGQCYHITLQIADLIFQFMAYSLTVNGENILYKLFGSLKEFLSEIYISFRNDILDVNKFSFRKQLILIEPKT